MRESLADMAEVMVWRRVQGRRRMQELILLAE
jgi:hypothetical protein